MLERFFLKPQTVDRICGAGSDHGSRRTSRSFAIGRSDADDSPTRPDPRGVRVLHRGLRRLAD